MTRPGASLSALAAAHYDGLFAFVAGKVRSRALAADLAQESWLRVIAAARRGEIANPRNYLFRTARNVVIDHFRKERARAGLFAAEADQEAVACDRPSPEREVAARRDLMRLLKVVGEMPLRRQQVFVLRVFEHLDQAEIAAALGVTRGAVEKHMRLALAFCLERFQPEI